MSTPGSCPRARARPITPPRAPGQGQAAVGLRPPPACPGFRRRPRSPLGTCTSSARARSIWNDGQADARCAPAPRIDRLMLPGCARAYWTIRLRAPSRSGCSMHGDRVVARVERQHRDGRSRGASSASSSAASETIVGRFEVDDGGPRLRRAVRPARADGHPRADAAQSVVGRAGEMVLVEITRWPTATRGPVGRVVEVLGRHRRARRRHARSSSASTAFPTRTREEAVEEARRLGGAVKERDIRGRTDFRDASRPSRSTASTRATSTTRSRSSGCRTATTGSACTSPTSSHYVHEGSALDEEAYERGTSVYFPERAVHMFPAELATGLCSLNPHVDRLVQSCLMEVDRRGEVVRYEMHDGVINSDARMTYTAVNAILTDRDRGRRWRSTATLVPMFELMHELFEILQRAPAPARLDRLRPAGGRGHARREVGEIEAIVAVRAQRRAPAHRGVHAAGQRDGGGASRRRTTCRRCTACTRRRTSRRWRTSRSSSRTLGYSLAAHGARAAAEALPEADRPHARHARGAADRGADAADDAEGALRRRAASGTSGWRRSTTRTSRRRSAAIPTSSCTACCASRGTAR